MLYTSTLYCGEPPTEANTYTGVFMFVTSISCSARPVARPNCSVAFACVACQVYALRRAYACVASGLAVKLYAPVGYLRRCRQHRAVGVPCIRPPAGHAGAFVTVVKKPQVIRQLHAHGLALGAHSRGRARRLRAVRAAHRPLARFRHGEQRKPACVFCLVGFRALCAGAHAACRIGHGYNRK